MASEKIGKYEIIGMLGKGGMGAIYKATRPPSKRILIIKASTFNQKMPRLFTTYLYYLQKFFIWGDNRCERYAQRYRRA